MATQNTRGILSTLTADGVLVGGSTVPALRALLQPEVREAFRLTAHEMEEAVLDNCEVNAAIVDEAHTVRVAVARRWAKGGASAEERRLAAEVDRVLLPYKDALLMLDEFDHIQDWLEDLWVDEDVDLDSASWWAFMTGAHWQQACEMTDGLRELWLVTRPPPPVREGRHEAAWDDGNGGAWYDCDADGYRWDLADWVCEQRDPEGVWA